MLRMEAIKSIVVSGCCHKDYSDYSPHYLHFMKLDASAIQNWTSPLPASSIHILIGRDDSRGSCVRKGVVR